jgi:DTW domain-containing protein YfiP
MTKRTRCKQCTRPIELCYCAQLPSIDNLWPVHILQHASEAKHAIGTARIAHLSLKKCAMYAYPMRDEQLPHDKPIALIYPGEGAQPLSNLVGSPVQHLMFIDATWRKSKRMLLETPAIAQLPRYSLAVTAPSRYLIRKEPNAQSLSTLEAIVSALELLEDAPARYHRLLAVMDLLIAQQTSRMPIEVITKNYSRD